MTRLSGYLLPTEREPPADAEAISHILMVRAGLIRQVGSGLWSWLPAGWRVHQKIVKDSYTFDRDAEGLDAQYQKHVLAYDRMMDRCGLEWYRVEADVGMMGGLGAHEYMAPCPAGENDVALAPGYAANVEVASAEAQPVELPPPLAPPELVHTPGMTTVDAVSRALEVPAGALLKAFPVVVDDGAMKLVVVRGDHRVNEIKLRTAL